MVVIYCQVYDVISCLIVVWNRLHFSVIFSNFILMYVLFYQNEKKIEKNALRNNTWSEIEKQLHPN